MKKYTLKIITKETDNLFLEYAAYVSAQIELVFTEKLKRGNPAAWIAFQKTILEDLQNNLVNLNKKQEDILILLQTNGYNSTQKLTLETFEYLKEILSSILKPAVFEKSLQDVISKQAENLNNRLGSLEELTIDINIGIKHVGKDVKKIHGNTRKTFNAAILTIILILILFGYLIYETKLKNETSNSIPIYVYDTTKNKTSADKISEPSNQSKVIPSNIENVQSRKIISSLPKCDITGFIYYSKESLKDMIIFGSVKNQINNLVFHINDQQYQGKFKISDHEISIISNSESMIMNGFLILNKNCDEIKGNLEIQLNNSTMSIAIDYSINKIAPDL
ncbi:MAG: hypothetical protein IPL74_04305 [Bacteroidetes bacterium]|nr:hypothetical protein [Bacteroidota bacterium]